MWQTFSTVRRPAKRGTNLCAPRSLIMAAPTLPLANSVVASPGAGLAYQEICALLCAYQQQIFELKASNSALRARVAEYDSCGNFVTASMRGALPAAELLHALHALAATERGRRLLANALRPTRGDPEYNRHTAVARRILDM